MIPPTARTMAHELKVLRLETSVLGEPGKCCGADLFAIVVSENVVGPALSP
jgi:hypothetical protein